MLDCNLKLRVHTCIWTPRLIRYCPLLTYMCAVTKLRGEMLEHYSNLVTYLGGIMLYIIGVLQLKKQQQQTMLLSMRFFLLFVK